MSLLPLLPERLATVRVLVDPAELSPAWLYARSLFHGKAPREVYAAALQSVATADLLRQFGRLPSPACDALASAVAEELYARPDFGPAAAADLDEDTRLRLADALQRRGRAECVPLYEQLLEPYRRAKSDGWVDPLSGLGLYYMRVNRSREAMGAFLRIDQYTTAPHVIADFQVEAARAGRAMPETKATAAALYAKAGASGHHGAWTQMIAARDRADRAVLEGKLDDAAALLECDVEGYHSAEARVGLLHGRALVAWDRQGPATALVLFHRLLESYQGIDQPSVTCQAWAREADEALTNSAISGDTQAVPVFVTGGPEPVYLRTGWDAIARGYFEVSAGSRDVALTVESPAALVVNESGWCRRGVFYRKLFAVEGRGPSVSKEGSVLRVVSPLCADGALLIPVVLPL